MITERLSSTLLDASPDGMLVVDAAGTVRIANRAADDLFGFGDGALIGRAVDDLVPTEQRGHHEALRHAYVGAPTSRPMGSGPQLFAQNADGDLFPVEISLSPVELDGESFTIATVRDLTQRRRDAAQLELLGDRERIARDLHDMVIQRLFVSGLRLQAVLAPAEPPFVRERISEVIDELDTTIREIRSAIFALSDQPTDRSLSDRLADTVADKSELLGFVPVLRVVDDEVDAVPVEVADHLVTTLGEVLTNVARHAAATSCRIDVDRTDERLGLVVCDDGVGISGPPDHQGGLANIATRAEMLGGECSAGPGVDGGTVVCWSVPL